VSTIVVREYARLTTDYVEQNLDQASISHTMFDWLCKLASSFKSNGATILQLENRRWLKLDNYVGILQSPCGTVLEVLPKHTDQLGDEAERQANALLRKMLEVALNLPSRTTQMASIDSFRHSLLEWVIQAFLNCLDHLIKRGLRFDYQRLEEEQKFLRGQLDVVKQMRQPPGKAHVFQIRHDVFLLDRPENRLLKTALQRICKITRQAKAWHISHELLELMSEVPLSKNISSDFSQWRDDRLMAHYQPMRVWCELVLGEFMPMALRGKTEGISLLFPMEKLFETYIGQMLKIHLAPELELKFQASSEYLCEHGDGHIFQLRPDFLVKKYNQPIMVLDAKWKLVSESDHKNKYGLSQSDFYQLHAYGHKYLNGTGEMFLIYPRYANLLNHISQKFSFSDQLHLWVVPFDLYTDKLYLPDNFQDNFPGISPAGLFSMLGDEPLEREVV